jgi:chemotaxis protein histidine kinase CheA
MAEKVKFIIEVDDQGGAKVVDNLNEKIEATGNTTEKTQGKVGKLGEQLAGIKGPVGQAVQTVQGLGTAFKALIANPMVLFITAIVGALTGLYKAFTSTKEGAETMKQIFDGVGAALDVLRDRVLKVGSAIVKFFSGDFKGAFAEAKGAVSGLTDEIAREAKEAANLRKELQNVADSERELNKSRAEQNKLIANARLVLEDENASYAERKKALEDVTKSEKQLAKQEEELTSRRFKAIAAQNALSDSSKEALDAEASAYIELQAAQENTLRVQRKLAMEAERLEKEEAAKRKQAAAERQAAEKAAADKRESDFQEWLAIEVAKADTEAANAKFVEDRLAKQAADEEAAFQEWLALEIEKNEIAQNNAKFVADREEADRKAKLDAEKAASDAILALKESEAQAQMELLEATSGALKSFASLAGEQTAAGKVLALASTVIDTYMGATKALAAGAGTPVGYINAAAIIATGLANVRTITAVQVPNEGGGSNISTPALNAAPSVGIVSGQMNQTNQLQAQLNSQMSRPTRAYVVGQNVTSQQSLDRHIAQNATL